MLVLTFLSQNTQIEIDQYGDVQGGEDRKQYVEHRLPENGADWYSEGAAEATVRGPWECSNVPAEQCLGWLSE